MIKRTKKAARDSKPIPPPLLKAAIEAFGNETHCQEVVVERAQL